MSIQSRLWTINAVMFLKFNSGCLSVIILVFFYAPNFGYFRISKYIYSHELCSWHYMSTFNVQNMQLKHKFSRCLQQEKYPRLPLTYQIYVFCNIISFNQMLSCVFVSSNPLADCTEELLNWS